MLLSISIVLILSTDFSLSLKLETKSLAFEIDFMLEADSIMFEAGSLLMEDDSLLLTAGLLLLKDGLLLLKPDLLLPESSLQIAKPSPQETGHWSSSGWQEQVFPSS